MWFVVGLPMSLYASGRSFTTVGGSLALWSIGYGVIQASALVHPGKGWCTSTSTA